MVTQPEKGECSTSTLLSSTQECFLRGAPHQACYTSQEEGGLRPAHEELFSFMRRGAEQGGEVDRFSQPRPCSLLERAGGVTLAEAAGSVQ